MVKSLPQMIKNAGDFGLIPGLGRSLEEGNSYPFQYSCLENSMGRGAWRAAAAKSLQSCPTLCDPRDDSPPGSPVPGILQARTLECVAISIMLAPSKTAISVQLVLSNHSFPFCNTFPKPMHKGNTKCIHHRVSMRIKLDNRIKN